MESTKHPELNKKGSFRTEGDGTVYGKHIYLLLHFLCGEPVAAGVEHDTAISEAGSILDIYACHFPCTHSIPPCTTVSVKSQELQIRQRANCPGPFWPEEKKEK